MSKDIKFKLTNETKVNAWGITLFRIEATVDITERGVKKGDKGGFVESTHLSNGNARVSGNAWVFGNAEVSGDARVFGNAEVSGDARVSGNAWVFGNAEVSGDARVSGNAWVFGNAEVSGDARVFGNAEVSGDARVFGNAEVSGDARVSLKKKYTNGLFLSSSDNTIVPTIIDQSKEKDFDSGTDYKNLLVVGDYDIEDVDPQVETIEIDGKKYRKADVENRLKELETLE